MYFTCYKGGYLSLSTSKELNRLFKRIRESRPIYIQPLDRGYVSKSFKSKQKSRVELLLLFVLLRQAAGAEGALTTKKPSCGSANEAAAVRVHCLRSNE